MSAGVVLDELMRADIVGESVFSDWSMEEVPAQGNFLILRWGDQNIDSVLERGPESLTVWAHQPREYGTDYTVLSDMLLEAKDTIMALEHAEGRDRRSVTSVRYVGASGNLYDPGFKTITRNITFQVLVRVVA